MYGIPNMKLEKFVVERRVSLMALEWGHLPHLVQCGRGPHAKNKIYIDAVDLCLGASHPVT